MKNDFCSIAHGYLSSLDSLGLCDMTAHQPAEGINGQLRQSEHDG